jgi:beta-lactam-binding protein with PASTA domain/tRNA A-37 threonylcarbamoyl transferase component Bud32
MPVLRSSELVGRVVGGRYRLLRPVGSGASAHVYVAEDVRLKRRVALKLLHPALAADAAFLRRFQAEAQTVAALRHQGIVRVYDWGEDAGNAYLTMELLEGGSLRSLLDTGHRLSVSQVAALGLDVAAALAYAHSRGLVHRDVKPANLLFDEEGHVSVADFGIARALAEASWTEPLGAMVGTARYAAPEQLKGVPLDGRADVYALALVVVEAVTGDVPFARDTSLGALMARADQSLSVPSALGPLAPVIEQAGTRAPEERLSAEAFAQAIATVAVQLRAPAPLPLQGLARIPGSDLGLEVTDVGEGRRPPPGPGVSILVDDLAIVEPGAWADAGTDAEAGADAEAVVGSAAGAGTGARAGADAAVDAGPGRDVPVRAATPTPRPAEAVRAGEDGAPRPSVPVLKPERRRHRLRRALTVVLVVAVLGAGGAAAVVLGRPAPTYAVPRVDGDILAHARAALAADHLQLSVAATQWSAAATESVISQFPVPGTRLHAKSTVEVTVSLGPEPVVVPDLSTLDVAQATSELRSARLRLGKVGRRPSTTVPGGIIISWMPRGHSVLPGTAINLVVSKGKPMSVVPPVGPSTSYVALATALKALHFKVVEVTTYSNDVPTGDVVSVSPPSGDREVVGSTVTVTVSVGPHLVTVPTGIVGLSVDGASKLLLGLGLYVWEVRGNPLSPVTGSQPAVGARVLYGKSVALVTR